MKKIKILACGSLLLCSGLMFAGCGEEPKDFEVGKITVGSQSVVYNGEEQIFSVGYTGEDVNVTYAKNTAENFVSAADLNLENAGTYTIYYKLSKDGYNDYISTAQTFEISEKEITVTLPTITDYIANAKTNQQLVNEVLSKYTYNQSDLVAGDTLGLNVSVGSYDKTLADAGDEYVLTATDNDSNYDITVVNGSYKLIDVVSIEKSGVTTYYPSIENAILNAQDGDTIKLNNDIITKEEISVNKSITIDGQGKYIIYANLNEFNSRRLISLTTAEKTLILKDITINAQNKARTVYANAGTLKIDGAKITNGKVSDSYIGGVYVTNSAKFIMTSGEITGNGVGEEYATDGYLQHSADLWIGANAEGELNAEISGGKIGSVFVNANEYSANDKGDFTMNGGTIENVYVEYSETDDSVVGNGYGAEFVYTDGVVENLYVSSLQSGEAVKLNATKGTTYTGGVVATATVGEVDTPFLMNDLTSGDIYTFLAQEENRGAYVKAYVDGNSLPTVLSIPEVDEIVLIRDVQLSSTLTINRTVVINGQNKFTIKASDAFTDRKLVALETENKVLTLKDITLDGNNRTRVVYVNAGTLVVNGATITKGKVSDSYIGGVYITSGASFVMTSGNITGNSVGDAYADGYLQYSADLWIGANAEGELNAEISGGVIGSVFVNANSYSASNKGDFTMTNGTIENVYVEYADGYGAEFVYVDGVVNNLYVSTQTTGEAERVTPVKGTTYIAGELA